MIDLHFPKWIAQLGERESEIYMLIAATLQTNRALMFDSSNSGRQTWAPPKLREGQPLSQRGPLRQSFAPSNDGKVPARHEDSIVRYGNDVVTIGTSVRYASILNTGGVIRPRNFPVLWIPLPDGAKNSSNAPSDLTKEIKGGKTGAPIVVGRNGKTYLLAKKVTIPARPMDQWFPQDQEELEVTLSNKVAQVLNG